MPVWTVEIDGIKYNIEGGNRPPTEQEARSAIQSYNSSRFTENYDPGLDSTPSDIAFDVARTTALSTLDRVPGYRPLVTHGMYVARSLTDPEYRKLPYKEGIKYASDSYLSGLGEDRNPAASIAGNLAGMYATFPFIINKGVGNAGQGLLKGISHAGAQGGLYGGLLSASDAVAKGELPSLEDVLRSTAIGAGVAGSVYGGLRGAASLGSTLLGSVSPKAIAYMQGRFPNLYRKLFKSATAFKNVTGETDKSRVISSINDDAVKYGTQNDPLFVTPNKYNEQAIRELTKTDVGSAKNIGFKVKDYRAKAASDLQNKIYTYGDGVGSADDIARRAKTLGDKYTNFSNELENASRDKYITYKDFIDGFNGDEVRARVAMKGIRDTAIGTGEEARILNASRIEKGEMFTNINPENLVLPPSAVNKYVVNLSNDASSKAANSELIDGTINALSKKFPKIRPYKRDYNKFFKISDATKEGRDIYVNKELTSSSSIREKMYDPVKTYKSGVGSKIDEELTKDVIKARKTGFTSRYLEDINEGSVVRKPNVAQTQFLSSEASSNQGDISKLIDKYNYLKRIDDIIDTATGSVKEPAVDMVQLGTTSAYSNRAAAALNSPTVRRWLNKVGLSKGGKRIYDFLQIPTKEVDLYMNPGSDTGVQLLRYLGGYGVKRTDEGRNK